ncbi:adenylate kinase [Trichonephila clavata]|uniref:DNA-directed RNA polymerase n=1 Tax=Trichonephila clavata TaxID=2740835 RepID=A0A8X6H083_TRICU|nr:adenylate kinase [Trichonephila clavata]
MIITIFGPPGSGKGTQSSLLIAKYSLKLISVGDLLRNIISDGSELGKKIKGTVESGNLIQDEIICGLLHDQLALMDDNCLLDGFPRNLNQAHFLTQVLQEKYNRDVDIVIELQLDDNIAIDRLKNRLACLDCKSIYSVSSFKSTTCAKCKSTRLEKRIDDADMSAINKRISEYHLQMKGLRKYYKGKLLTIDANLSVDEVTQEIESIATANVICHACEVDKRKRVSELRDEDIEKISSFIRQNYVIEGELRKEVAMNIKSLVEMGCYRGVRHRKGLPVRGQRTHTNAKTRKGSRKSTPYAAGKAAEAAAKNAMERFGMKVVSVIIRGPGFGTEAAVKALQSCGLTVTSIADKTAIPHNGCSSLDKLIKPSSVKVISDDSSEKSDIVLEPLESGFALTLGNALRRVMLSSLKGSAVYGIKIEGVTHEFTSIQGVREDVTDIVLNMGMLRCKLNSASNKCLNLNAKGPCQVLAGMIETDDQCSIVNKDLLICTLGQNVELNMTIYVASGKGYLPVTNIKKMNF